MAYSLKLTPIVLVALTVMACSKNQSDAPKQVSYSELHWSSPHEMEHIKLSDSLELSLTIDALWGLHEYSLEIRNSQDEEIYYDGGHSHQWAFELNCKISFASHGPGTYSLRFKAINHNSETLEKICTIQVTA